MVVGISPSGRRFSRIVSLKESADSANSFGRLGASDGVEGGQSATFGIGTVNIFAYGNVDPGQNNSYSDVSTGTNNSYSDVATGSNNSYTDVAA